MAYVSTCHCGAVSATVEGDLPSQGMTCNCSICRRKGNIHHFVGADQVTLQKPAGGVGSYSFNKHAIRHQFCNVCGCAPFAEGEMPDGTRMVEINLRCVADCDIASLTITEVDGASL